MTPSVSLVTMRLGTSAIVPFSVSTDLYQLVSNVLCHLSFYLYITWLDFALERLKASLSYNISEAKFPLCTLTCREIHRWIQTLCSWFSQLAKTMIMQDKKRIYWLFSLTWAALTQAKRYCVILMQYALGRWGTQYTSVTMKVWFFHIYSNIIISHDRIIQA